jgi:amidase
MDAERKAGKVRGPLHGIPFTVKDNIASKDNLETTAGSWALVGSIVPRDAFVVAKLRDAGAVLFGKATLSEWADMRSNNYSEGYSGRGGQCRSAYNFTVNPGGSSSGSAVGVAANAIAFALGTETDGSGELLLPRFISTRADSYLQVINPAERNSIVGFKPTVGLTSRAG